MSSKASQAPCAASLRLVVLLIVGGAAACSSVQAPASDAGPRDAPAVIVRCSAAGDPDDGFISGIDEGEDDPDGDGTPNREDDDSDGDGLRDIDESGDRDCTTPPIDSDHDGIYDFLDTDGNGDGVLDRDQRELDTDGDGIVDARDPDTDGDSILNTVERGDGPEPRDSDSDGIADVLDRDSDSDTIDDQTEGALDRDRDGIPNYLDDDSDGDGIRDAVEAGDGSLATPPVSCAQEIDAETGEIESDGTPDFLDGDSDNDGLGDADEVALGTDLCVIDTDGDGQDDLAEGAYQRINCPNGTGRFCDCATNDACTIPEQHFYVVLPYGGPAIERDLDFGTTIRVADVFFISDTTGSMSGTLENVQETVAGAGGLIDRITETIPDVWIGGGSYDDYPFGTYGSPSEDDPFELAIRMTPSDRASDVRDAFGDLEAAGGGDGPESGTEALYQIMTGEGGTWMGGGRYSMPSYADDCLDTGWGAPCFRDAALPIVVLFTDICSHNGPPDDDLGACQPYESISPAPALWEDAIAAMNLHGAKFVGVNARSWGTERCTEATEPSGDLPCWFLRRTAVDTGSIDLEMRPLVYDLPDDSEPEVFVNTIVEAIETVATRVPLDVDTALRDDPSDGFDVDASDFIKRRQPACNTAGVDQCWEPPPEIEHDDAVVAYDTSTFFGVVPGTRVTFTITFQNDFREGGATAQIFIAYIDVRGGGSSVLDTRQVFVVVPASSDGGFG